MYYIKLDEDGNPVDHPLVGDNLKQVLEVSILDDATLEKHGYARFEFAPRPENGVTTPLPEYYVGEDGVVRNRIEFREFTQEEKVDRFIRARRSYLLAACDWTQSPDSPLTDEKKNEWAVYRQALRDLTSEYPDVETADEVEWPEAPE